VDLRRRASGAEQSPLSHPTEVGEVIVDWRFKSFPGNDASTNVSALATRRWNALGGDLSFPVVILRRSALEHNIALMAEYCRSHGVSLAPHAKTPIAPQVVQLQLEAGAWGITVANLHQCRVLRHFGAARLLLANQVVELPALAWIVDELERSPNFDFMCLVDSVAGVALMDELLSGLRPRSPIKVLLEVGIPGGRAGTRSRADAIAVAQAVLASRHLRLVGIEGYEGMIPADRSRAGLEAVDAFLVEMRALANQLHRNEFFDGESEIIVSAGGSLYFDRVVRVLAAEPWTLGQPVRVLLRSGSYITHAAGRFDELAALGSGHHAAHPGALEQALEIWGVVLSRPEPDLAILGFGKRDVPYDDGLPMAFEVRMRSGLVEPLGPEAKLLTLNDQHARLRVPARIELGPGDLVGFHVTHPCTTFDKWRLVPIVDDEYLVVDALLTYF
jgi:D-serine dehydratase